MSRKEAILEAATQLFAQKAFLPHQPLTLQKRLEWLKA